MSDLRDILIYGGIMTAIGTVSITIYIFFCRKGVEEDDDVLLEEDDIGEEIITTSKNKKHDIEGNKLYRIKRQKIPEEKIKKMVFSRPDELKYKELFEGFDVDGDKTMRRDDVNLALRAALGKGINKYIVDGWLMELDVEGTNKVDFNGFLRLINRASEEKKAAEEEVIRELNEAFDVFDRDGSDTCLTDELKITMLNCCERFTREDVDALIYAADPDNSGKITRKSKH